jgi:carbon-monoxide dehydrogenase large subunit/6-hydroxypseudooxynicotine dehydrogenase subunit gamma
MSGVFGRSVTRLEDPPLVRGAGRFVGDVSLPGQLHMRVVRSSQSHGIIRSVSVAAAQHAPGVTAVWTAQDVADLGPIDFRDPAGDALKPYRQPVLARDRVRYVGEPLAAIFAENPYAAEDAAELVEAEIDPLPVLLSAEAAVGEFAAGLTTEAAVLRQSYGEVEEAFRNAHAVIALELRIGRHSGVPLETRGAIGRYDGAHDRLELIGATKVPHRNREAIARMFGRSPESVVLRELHVGGGFGVRGELYPEDFLVCAAAMRLGRPIKWIEDRREHLMAANQSREQIHQVRAAVRADGRVLALDDVFFVDQGAYVRTHGARVPDMTMGMLPGPYRIPAFRATAHFRLTNKTPAATCRGPGRFESAFVRERLFDAVADRLGLDRVQVRRRNLIAADEMPFARPMTSLGHPLTYDSGDYPRLLEKALAHIDWSALRQKLARRRAAGESVGAGVCLFVEDSGLGPRDAAEVSIDPSGQVEVVTGGASLGQGFETVIAQICADALGIDHRGVRVIHGQTDRIAAGIGAHASRATVMTGNAVHAAARALRQKAIAAAAEVMQIAPEGLDIVAGEVRRCGREAGPSITLGALARQLTNEPGTAQIVLRAEGTHETAAMTYAYGAHFCVLNVDRETGSVAIEKFLVAYDIGRAVNPFLVEGQIVGGLGQGVGGTLLEEFRYDDRGEPLCVTLADYLLPTVREMPPVDVLLTEDAPSPLNPLGIKGAGEGGVTGAGAAIAAAIDDAVGRPGLITELPVTPQRLVRLLRNHGLQFAFPATRG